MIQQMNSSTNDHSKRTYKENLRPWRSCLNQNKLEIKPNQKITDSTKFSAVSKEVHNSTEKSRDTNELYELELWTKYYISHGEMGGSCLPRLTLLKKKI